MNFAAKIIATVCLFGHISEAKRSKKIISHDAELVPKAAAKSMALTSSLKHKANVVSKTILNHSDLQVMISVFVGSNQERHKLIVDTGSMWTWIQNKACYNCGSWSDFTPETSTSW